MDIKISQADNRDKKAINNLIRKSKLGTGIRGTVQNYWIVREGDQLIACCGMDMHGKEVSVMVQMVVENTHRRKGIGSALAKHFEGVARMVGAKTLALCTPQWNVKFYRRLGYEVCKRAKLPENVRNYWEFTAQKYKWCSVMIRDI